MTTTSYPDTFRPTLRPEIVFGPRMLIRGRYMHYLKDTVTNWFHQIDDVEYFILRKMDGTRSIEQINEEIQQRYGHKIDEHAWQKLLIQIGERQMLVESLDEAKVEELKRLDQARRRTEHTGLLRARLSLPNPNGFFEKLHPFVRFAFHPLFVLPAIALLLLTEAYVVLNLPALVAEGVNSYKQVGASITFVIFFILLTFLPVLHEMAHGVTCKHFGGSVPEIGVIWRYLTFFPYCKIDDIVLFHNRWHRIYVAFAGTFFSLLVMIPFAVVWMVSPGQSILKDLSALMLTVYNLGSLINFVPFIELDGYYMLAHLLGMPDLRQSSNEYWSREAGKLLFSHAKTAHHFHHFGNKGARTYTLYGAVAILFTTAFMLIGLYFWLMRIRQWVGDIITWVLVAIVVLYFLSKALRFTLRLFALRQPALVASVPQVTAK